ncbi:MAG: ABC transporter ATP-binding protein [Oscillospiraceae bacterium]|nr:ABC transporter ATP-binding protein [Oscillospiraceae bacterium]MDD4413533.1 ABC transporter ATP-binding protein [Oscillospiraceae bacterium]
MSNIISAKNIIKQYQNGVAALKGIDLELEKSKFYAVMGHSGSGKSTLLQIMGLLDGITKGSLSFMGKDVSKLTENRRAEIRMKHIGFVFQSFYLNSKMNAFENVMLPMFINPEITSPLKNRAVDLLKKLGVGDRANHFPKELSGGEQQRVAIARALANNPTCVFADEPTGNLDADNEVKVFEILKMISQEGKCVFVVSHNPLVKKYADKVFQMKSGLFI